MIFESSTLLLHLIILTILEFRDTISINCRNIPGSYHVYSYIYFECSRKLCILRIARNYETGKFITCRFFSKKLMTSLHSLHQQYPYARLGSGTGQFEPPQPKGSIYLSTSPNSMGILLLPTEKKKARLTPNPAFNALRVVYNPSDQSDTQSTQNLQVTDPSSINISFVPYSRFEAEERIGSEAAQKEQAQNL